MAPPPKRIIVRKLIKKFFENYLPRAPIGAQEEMSKLFDCWQRHGLDDAECKEAEIIFDHMIDTNYKYQNRLNSLGLKQAVTSKLATPLYKHDLKGRFRTDPLRERRRIPLAMGVDPLFGKRPDEEFLG
eukprot:TRINITY_DN4662_c0_g1_i4.p1 TRINITY_DN4662_c0_g1~~TRINITY_DN4662_c0_g1_i4.p1  ORF type:complete len:129 (+),score=44.81 TRINITY_DN4662_c0_g1_i4:59-445(+)